MENENPFIKQTTAIPTCELEYNDLGKLKYVTKEAIYQLIRDIKDPEHPYSLEQLSVINWDDVDVKEDFDENVICKAGQPYKYAEVVFTPTVPHCSMAGIIGLTIIYKLRKYVDKYDIVVKIKEGTHSQYQAFNKQLSDKDRIMAAFENEGMVDMIMSCIEV